jgi:peptidyl-lysine (3S)-dioxygenase / protease
MADDGDDPLLSLACAAAVTRARCSDLSIPRVAGPIDPTHFREEFVLSSTPVILTGCIDHWRALHQWTHPHLRAALGDKEVHVALTPDGLADAVSPLPDGAFVFARPHEARMPFSTFVDAIESPLQDDDGRWLRAVHYASHQNSSLDMEFAPLAGDVGPLAWADTAFRSSPSATNLWMGEDTARTTVHADLYDNVYAVVRGEKQFTLLPPGEGGRLNRQPYRAATWTPGTNGLELLLDEPAAYVPWSSLDLERDGADLQPIRATVRAGEVLFLPALWWHAVSQRATDDPSSGASTIAVNYWYESADL